MKMDNEQLLRMIESILFYQTMKAKLSCYRKKISLFNPCKLIWIEKSMNIIYKLKNMK